MKINQVSYTVDVSSHFRHRYICTPYVRYMGNDGLAKTAIGGERTLAFVLRLMLTAPVAYRMSGTIAPLAEKQSSTFLPGNKKMVSEHNAADTMWFCNRFLEKIDFFRG